MPLSPADTQSLQAFMAAPVNGDALATFLLEHCNLPGARANLELVAAVVRESLGRVDLQPVYADWLEIETAKNDPREFLSLTAAAALGGVYLGAGADSRTAIVELFATAANDSRWRVREGVSMGLQRIGESSFGDLEAILRPWMNTPSLLQQRAIVAALAHPPFLKARDAAETAVALSRPIALGLASIPSSERNSDGFKVLKQGLSFTLSVVAAAAPEPGFALLHDLVATGDRDLAEVVAANLDKARLAKAFPSQVAELRDRLR
jgi:hypothetical protein